MKAMRPKWRAYWRHAEYPGDFYYQPYRVRRKFKRS